METAYTFSKSLKDLLESSFIKDLIEDLKTWPGPVLKRHNDAKLLIHKLAFLTDLGWNINDEGAATPGISTEKLFSTTPRVDMAILVIDVQPETLTSVLKFP